MIRSKLLLSLFIGTILIAFASTAVNAGHRQASALIFHRIPRLESHPWVSGSTVSFLVRYGSGGPLAKLLHQLPTKHLSLILRPVTGAAPHQLRNVRYSPVPGRSDTFEDSHIPTGKYQMVWRMKNPSRNSLSLPPLKSPIIFIKSSSSVNSAHHTAKARARHVPAKYHLGGRGFGKYAAHRNLRHHK